MPNNVAVSITADVAGLQVGMAKARAELQAAQKDLAAYVKEARTTGETDELKTKMLAAGDAVAKARSQVALLSREMATNAEHAISGRAATEGLVLVHEALSGRYTRMTSSAMILTQALAGQERMASVLGAVMSPLGLAIAGVTAAALAGVVAAYQYEKAEKDVADAALGLGAASGVSAVQIKQLSNDALGNLKTSYGENVEALKAFTAAGVRNQGTLRSLLDITADFAALTGQKTADAVKELAQAMADPAKGAEEINRQLNLLDATQLRHIQTLVELGEKEQAQAELTKALADRSRDAADAVGSLENPFDRVGKAAAFAAHAMAEALVTLQRFDAVGSARGVQSNVNAAADRVQEAARLRQQSAAAAALLGDTPEAKAESDRNRLQGQVNVVREGLQADIKLYGERSAAVKRDRDALAEYTRALQSYLSPAEKAHAVAALDAQIAEARHKHNAQLVEDLTKQRELMNLSGQVMSQGEAQQRAADAARTAGARTSGSSAGAESPLTKMETELRASEFKIREQTGDWSKDMQAFEVDFWTKKLETAKAGSKLYGEILTRLQQAQLDAGRQGAENARQISVNNAETDVNIGRSHLEERRRGADRDFDRAENDPLKISAEEKARILKEVAQQETDLEISAQEKKKQAYANDVVAVNAAANEEKTIRARLADQLAEIERQATEDKVKEENRRAEAAKKAAEEQAKAWKTANGEILSAESQLVGSMMSGRTNLGQELTRIALQMAEREIAADIRYWTERKLLAAQGTAVEAAQERGGMLIHLFAQTQKTGQTVASQAAQTGATAAGVAARTGVEAAGEATSHGIMAAFNEKKIMSDAAKAASGAYSAVAGIPIIGPVLAPAAAATAYAGVMAFENLASFDKGTNFVPTDMVAQIHAGERIVPAADNQAMIAAMSGGGGRGGGDTHIHNNLTHAPQITSGAPTSVVKALEANKRDFARLLRGMARDGHFKAA